MKVARAQPNQKDLRSKEAVGPVAVRLPVAVPKTLGGGVRAVPGMRGGGCGVVGLRDEWRVGTTFIVGKDV